MELHAAGLLPSIVQVGNEINPMILQQGALQWPIDWTRNATLINRGLQAVDDAATASGTPMETTLHIAQPENGIWWFEQATTAGVTNYDWIGLSYYSQWSDFPISEVRTPLSQLINTYSKKLMVVETAYPFTLENQDPANNIMGSNALQPGYPATPQGQLDYMNALRDEIAAAGGGGLIYWEPAWISTGCSTLWAQGSHWDNATMFDASGRAHVGLDFYNAAIE